TAHRSELLTARMSTRQHPRARAGRLRNRMSVAERNGLTDKRGVRASKGNDRGSKSVAPDEAERVRSHLPSRCPGKASVPRVLDVRRELPTAPVPGGNGVEPHERRDAMIHRVDAEFRRPVADCNRVTAGDGRRSALALLCCPPTEEHGVRRIRAGNSDI